MSLGYASKHHYLYRMEELMGLSIYVSSAKSGKDLPDLIDAPSRSGDSDAPSWRSAGSPSSNSQIMAEDVIKVMVVHRFRKDNSVFIDGEYLIKGVAGAILWRLLNEYQDEGREIFNNRELRLDQSLNLPEIGDNLEVRLALLKRRLEAHGPHLRINKVSRGLFRLYVARPLKLRET